MSSCIQGTVCDPAGCESPWVVAALLGTGLMWTEIGQLLLYVAILSTIIIQMVNYVCPVCLSFLWPFLALY